PDDRWVPVEETDPLTGAPITIYKVALPRSPNSGVVTNPDGFAYLDRQGHVLGHVSARRSYQGLIFPLSRRLSRRWQAQASFVLSRSRGTVDNDFDNAGDRSYTNNPTKALVNADGKLVYDPGHELKLLASYEVPRIDLTVSGYFSAIGGTRYAP